MYYFKNKQMCLLLDLNENTCVLCSNYKIRFAQLKLQAPQQSWQTQSSLQLLTGIICYSVIGNMISVDSAIYYS